MDGFRGRLRRAGRPLLRDRKRQFRPVSANFPNPSALTTPNGNPGLPIDGDYGDSFVKVQVDTVHDSPANQNVNGWGLQVVDYFTPSDQAALDSADEDLGSGAPTLLPQSAGSAAHPFLLVGGGKEGTLYLIDRGTDNTTMTMGEFHADTDDAVQEQGDAVNGILSTPAYFNGNLYVTSGYNSGPMYEFSINNAQLAHEGTDDRRLWGPRRLAGDLRRRHGERHRVGPGTQSRNQLRAYSAANLSDEIYNSSDRVRGRPAFQLGPEILRPHGGQRRRLRGHGRLAGDVWIEHSAQGSAGRSEQPGGHHDHRRNGGFALLDQ